MPFARSAVLFTCAGLVSVAWLGGMYATRKTGDPPSSVRSYPVAATEAPRPAPAPAHRWVTRRGTSFGYESSLSDNDLAAGLATKALVMIDFNGVVNGDYSFTTYNPITGNMIVMRCAEPCAYMNVMNYDHRAPETFPVTRGSVMQAMVLDARAGFLSH